MDVSNATLCILAHSICFFQLLSVFHSLLSGTGKRVAEIDPLSLEVSTENQWWLFKEDMLQLTQPRFNRLLDIGWYPEGDMLAGCYRLVVYNGDFTGQLLHQFETRDRVTLVAGLQDADGLP